MSDLPGSWARCLAGDVCSVVGGATPRTDTPEFWGGDIPWITPDDLSRDRRQYVESGRRSLTTVGLSSCAATLVPAATVLFTSRAPIGYAAIASRQMATNQGFKSLVPSAGLRSEFLFWQLRHLTAQIRAMGSGTTFAEVSKKVMADVPLVLPPTPEQERIVAAIEEAFSKLDAGEAALQTARQRLKRMRDAVLTAAVTGRLVPQDPTDTPASEVLTGPGRATAKPSEPTLPSGWSRCELMDVTSLQEYGISLKTREDERDGDVPVLRMGNIQSGAIDPSRLKFVSGADDRVQERLLVKGDLLFNRTNSAELVGKAAVYRGIPPRASFASYLIRVRPFPDVEASWCSFVINSRLGRRYIESVAVQQVGQANVNGTKLKHFPMPLPPSVEQRRIVAEVERQFSFIEACDRAIDAGLARSAALRRSLLKVAFEGRLVAQDPWDEPASMLLERIRAERATSEPVTSRRRRRPA